MVGISALSNASCILNRFPVVSLINSSRIDSKCRMLKLSHSTFVAHPFASLYLNYRISKSCQFLEVASEIEGAYIKVRDRNWVAATTTKLTDFMIRWWRWWESNPRPKALQRKSTTCVFCELAQTLVLIFIEPTNIRWFLRVARRISWWFIFPTFHPTSLLAFCYRC